MVADVSVLATLNSEVITFHKMCPFTISVPNPRYRNMSSRDKSNFCMLAFGQSTPPDEYVMVPCGHCKFCLRKKRTEWRLRLLQEHTCHTKVLFVTLSIAPRYYKDFINDPSPFLRKFFDNLRKKRKIHPNKMIKHWFITEGGDTAYDEHRFHFHGFLFGVVKRDLTYREIRKCWPYGHSWITLSSARLCNYTTKYITKESLTPQRIFTSAGVGSSAESFLTFDKSVYRFVGSFTLRNRARRYFIPRYYNLRHPVPVMDLISVLGNRYARGLLTPSIIHCGVIYASLRDFHIATLHNRLECFNDFQFQDFILSKPYYSKFLYQL